MVSFASLYPPYGLPLLDRRRDPLQRRVHTTRLLDLLLIELDQGDPGTAARLHAGAAVQNAHLRAPKAPATLDAIG